MSSEQAPPVIRVPGQRTALSPPAPDRVRALKRHIVESLRDLAAARRPERLVQKRGPEPDGFAAAVVSGVCGHCRGACCMSGGTHAFLDERTFARLCRERPGLTARGIVTMYAAAIAPEGVAGSCLYHGPRGCTLSRGLRAELCNAYYCDGLDRFLKHQASRPGPVTVETHDGLRTVLRA